MSSMFLYVNLYNHPFHGGHSKLPTQYPPQLLSMVSIPFMTNSMDQRSVNAEQGGCPLTLWTLNVIVSLFDPIKLCETLSNLY